MNTRATCQWCQDEITHADDVAATNTEIVHKRCAANQKGMAHVVAVYGTLKRGFGNHRVIAPGQFLGTDTTPGFVMHSLGGFPGVVRGDGTIHIEVYAVDDQTMGSLDCLEGYRASDPLRGFYDRVQIDTRFGRAWLYVYNGSLVGRPRVRGGNYGH